MIPLNLVQLDSIPILQQLRWEEALLRTNGENWCLINYGSPPAIVMGISGKVETLIDQEHYRKKPIPLIRRFSGGGTVLVDEETLLITFIFNANCLPISPFPLSIMRWTEQLYRPIFHPLPFELRENDYVLGHRKFGGNAQSIIKNRWLHHSSLLWKFDPSQMNYLLLPSRRPSYREDRSHADFLCSLSSHWPSASHFQAQLVGHLQHHFGIQKVEGEELEKIARQPHRQATTLVGQSILECA